LSKIALWVPQIVLLCSVGGAVPAQKRPVTVADSIEAQSFGTPLDEALSKPPAIFSPKNDRCVVVMRRGLIAPNVNRYSLTLFQTDALSSAAPVHLLDMDSSSVDPAIDMVQWSLDGERLLFLGETPGQARQLYRFEIRGRKLHQLTHADASVMSYATTTDQSTLVFLTKPLQAPRLDANRTDPLIVSGQTLASLLGGSEDSGALQHYRLFVQRRNEAPKQVTLGDAYPDLDNGITISPDGKHATVALLAEDRPQAWSRYKFPSSMRWIVRYFLVDTLSGHIEPLLDAPSSNWRPELAWDGKSQTVVIAGTYLPLEAKEFREQVPESRQATVEVQIKDHSLSLIATKPLHLVQWDPLEQELALQDGDAPPVVYRKSGSTWDLRGPWIDAESSRPSVDMREDQGMDQPPRLVAVDSKTGDKKVAFDPNPQFASLIFGDVKEIEWKTADGHPAKGGLYLPVHYVSGRRYPLVIQTHGWSKGKFWMDGPSTAGYAAQELAGRGFVVAQIEGPAGVTGWQSTPQEGPLLMSMVEGLIDDLDRKGLVDRERVGILGWSRSAYLTRYTLVFSRYSFRAAVLADGYDDGYFHYLARLNLGKAEAAEYERMVGAAPFGDGLNTWFHNSTGFNLGAIRTPVRILGFSPSSLLANWEWFAGLNYLSKPVEFMWIPNAGHAPTLPGDRLLAEEGDVDWFDFWLNGQEDPNPMKREQYLRWEALRAKQGQNTPNSQATP
jgi:dipeptidyl aminopeptidase/acylaminoacyl peptidase